MKIGVKVAKETVVATNRKLEVIWLDLAGLTSKLALVLVSVECLIASSSFVDMATMAPVVDVVLKSEKLDG